MKYIAKYGKLSPTKKLFCVSTLFSLFLFPIFYCSQKLLEKNYFSWVYFCFLSILSALGIIYFLLFRKNKTFHLNRIDLVVLLYFGYIHIHSLIMPHFSIIPKQLIIFFLLPFYFLIRLFKKDSFYVFAAIIVGLCCIQLMVGILQASGIVNNVNEDFLIAGTLGNPNVFAGLLITGIPFAYFLLLKNTNQLSKILLSFLILASVVLIIVVKSRGAMLAIFLLSVVVLIKQYSRNKIVLILSFLVFILGLIFLFNFKQDSSFGRLLIWKVSTQAISTHAIWGFGFNAFPSAYIPYQSGFLENCTNNQYLLVAGEPYWAYNEIIEHIFEGGFIAGLLWICLYILPVIFIIFKWQRIKSIAPKDLSILAVLLVFIVLSMINFTFTVYPFLLLALTTLAWYSNVQKPLLKLQNRTIMALTLIWLLGSIVPYIKTVKYLPQSYQIRKILTSNKTSLHSYSKIQEIAIQYPDYDRLQFICSVQAYQINKLNEAIIYIDRAIETRPNFHSKIHKAKLLIQMEKYEEAKLVIKEAENQLPSRLTPKYMFFQLSKIERDSTLAVELAKEIIEFQVKVESNITDKYKRKAYQFINEMSYENN